MKHKPGRKAATRGTFETEVMVAAKRASKVVKHTNSTVNRVLDTLSKTAHGQNIPNSLAGDS